jgi:hypothetical protein
MVKEGLVEEVIFKYRLERSEGINHEISELGEGVRKSISAKGTDGAWKWVEE